MALFDIIILFIIGLLAVMGFVQGFIRELAEIIGLIGGIILTIFFAVPLAKALPPESWSDLAKTPLAAIIILVGFWLLARLVAFLIRKILVHGPLKSMDRLLGGLFGALKGFVLVMIILILMTVSPLKAKVNNWTDDAPVATTLLKMTGPLVKQYERGLDNLLSKDLKKAVKKGQKKAEKIVTSTEETLDDAKVYSELIAFIKDFSAAETLEDQKDKIKNLSPDAKKYLESITDQIGDQGSDLKETFKDLPAELKKLLEKIPTEKISEALKDL